MTSQSIGITQDNFDLTRNVSTHPKSRLDRHKTDPKMNRQANASAKSKEVQATAPSLIIKVIGIPLALITIKIIKDYLNVEPLLNEISDEIK